MSAIRLTMFIEYGLVSAIALLIIFQVFVPLLAGTPFFPILRHKTRDAVADLAEATEEREIRDVKKAAADILRDATTKRKGA